MKDNSTSTLPWQRRRKTEISFTSFIKLSKQA